MLINTVTPDYLGWKPGANTIGYWKYENNLNDSSGNGHTLTNVNSISYSSSPSAVNLSSSNYLYFNNTDSLNHDWTLNTWVYLTGRNGQNSGSTIISQGSGGNYHIIYVVINYYGRLAAGVFGDDLDGTIETPLNQWINICVTFNYSTRNIKTFVNGVKDTDRILSSSYSVPAGNFYIGGMADDPSSSYWKIKGSLSNTILESAEWSESLVTTNYNQTKYNYGL